MNGLFVAGRCFGHNPVVRRHGKMLSPPSRATIMCHESTMYTGMYMDTVCGAHIPTQDARQATCSTANACRTVFSSVSGVCPSRVRGVCVSREVWRCLYKRRSMAHTHTFYSQACLFFFFKSTTLYSLSVPHTCLGNLLLQRLHSLFFFSVTVCAGVVESLDGVLHVDKLPKINNTSHGKLLKRI